MTRTGKRAVAVYLLTMVVLAAMGALNQDRLDRYTDLLALKNTLIVESGQLRSQAEAIRGPAAVASWATAAGMIAVPANDGIEYLEAVTGPTAAPAPTGLEVHTRWR